MWNIDLSDTDLDLVDTDIPGKHFVCLQDALKTSWRHVFKMSSRHVFKTCLQDMSSRRLQDMSSRRLQDIFSVTIFCLPRRLQDVFKTLWKTKNCYAEDILKTSSRSLQDQQMFAGVFTITIQMTIHHFLAWNPSKVLNGQHKWVIFHWSRISPSLVKLL